MAQFHLNGPQPRAASNLIGMCLRLCVFCKVINPKKMRLNPRALFNVCARRISVSSSLQTLRSGPFLDRFSVLSSAQSRCYSSGSDKNNGLNSTTNQLKDSLLDDDVSTEELKRKIDNFYQGDADSLPSLFEAILKRKLSGKHEDADDEVMKEIRQRRPGQVEDFDEEYDSGSDFDELKETDEGVEYSSDANDSEEEDRRI